MKKVFLFLVLFAITISCSDDNDSWNNNISINPPEWIQGTWLLEGSYDSGFKFTTDDICLIFLISQACNKEQLIMFNNSGAFTNVSEEITDNSYSIDITIVSGVTSYEFEKVSDTEIIWLNAVSEGVIYVKQ